MERKEGRKERRKEGRKERRKVRRAEDEKEGRKKKRDLMLMVIMILRIFFGICVGAIDVYNEMGSFYTCGVLLW